MVKKATTTQRREDALSREIIIEAAIRLLDSAGEAGLTFRALSEHLATGPGAIYWHVANKGDLLVAACDAVMAGVLATHADAKTPENSIRALALGVFDAMDRHPWIGSALLQSAGQLPSVRLLEYIGQQVQALGVTQSRQWSAASALLHYMLGIGGQNAANRQYAQALAIEREEFLRKVADAWESLDEKQYPFTRSMAAQLCDHDDREDFLVGIDLIIIGLRAPAKART